MFQGSDTLLTATLGFRGQQGYSAYEIAVQNGFIGTEQDWLATIGTTNYVGETKATFSASVGQKVFGLPTNYTSNSIVEVYIEGAKLNANLYTINASTRELTLTNAIAINGTTVEIVLLTMEDKELPIVETISNTSVNTTVPGTKAVYDFVTSRISVITGSKSGIGAGATEVIDVAYPSGFTKTNTLIIGKMVSSNNSYYDVADVESTASGFPTIKMIALTDTNIRVWIENTNTTEARVGYYKITLMRQD